MHSVERSADHLPPPLPDRDPIVGHALILELEDIYGCLAEQRLQKNPFWTHLTNSPDRVADRVYHGLCIENYHLLVRESYFDAPALAFPSNRAVKQLLNEFYCEEIGHDRLLLRSLVSLDLDEESLFDTVPLATTMALCNALSFWARHDPLFFLATLGPLEGREIEIDSFVDAARSKGLPDAFVGPIATHAGINKDAAHGSLTRKIFAELGPIPAGDAARLRRQMALFVDIYDRFYRGIWTYYGTDAPLLRRVSQQ
jgi:hypothetical protein